MWAFIASFLYWLIAFAGFALLVAYLAGIWIDYTDGRDDDGLTERLNDTLERELSEYGASEGSDRIIYPFRSLTEAMKEKDPELYEKVGPMSPASGFARWREKYPEDFV